MPPGQDAIGGIFKAIWRSLIEHFAKPAGADKGAIGMSMELGSGYDREAEEKRQRAAVVAYMRGQIGDPYTYGAEIQPGHELEAATGDCSEYVEAAFRVAGLYIPDGCVNQRAHCRKVRAPKLGDLLILKPNKKGIPHVMVCTDDGSVIHALGGVGVVEQPLIPWADHVRFDGYYRHPDFSLPVEERAI